VRRLPQISETVSEACGGRLETISLANRRVDAWRRRALGETCAWEPTLIEVTAGAGPVEDVRAWTGWSMVGPITRHLGRRDAIKVTRALGTLKQSWDDIAERRGLGARLSRSGFFRLASGAVVGAGLLSGRPALAPAAQGAPKVVGSAAVRGSALRRGVREVLADQDVANVLGRAELRALRAGALETAGEGAVLRLSDAGETRFGPQDVRAGQVRAVAQGRHRVKGGVELRTTALSLERDRMLIVEQYSPSHRGVRSLAQVYELDESSKTLELFATSEDGARDRAVGEVVAKAACENGYPRDDPCGGCCLTGPARCWSSAAARATSWAARSRPRAVPAARGRARRWGSRATCA